MRLSLVLWIATIATLARAEPNAASPTFEPGKEVRLNVGKTVGEILVYVPSDYNDDCNWPAIFHYHGKGGTLSTKWLQIATCGKGFVIVSVEFAPTTSEQLNPTQYRAYLEREIKNIGFTRHWLQSQLKIDPKKTILEGVSRGGWLVADIFLLRPRLAAAAVIMCAGYHNWLPEDALSLADKYVYIGAGETDQNLEAAKKAARYFENRNADVTFEIYGGLGHNINPNSPKLKKWFSDLRSNLNRQATEMKPSEEIKQ
jgi:dipeptidyl aminopeptidase/acylaminoacyl peptidase